MRTATAILLALAAVTQSAAIPATYQNPVIEQSVPDPTVLRADDGFYYMMGTEDIWNVPVFRSPDLVRWTQTGTVFDRDTRPAEGQVWAPELCRINGKYVLFYCVNIPEKDAWACYIGYAVADRPDGPWTNRGKLFDGNDAGCDNAIDPFYFFDSDRHYLFWGSTTNMWAMEIDVDADLNISFDLSRKVQTAGKGVEGTEIYKRDGMYYMFASIGSYAWTTYRVVVGRSENVLGPYTDRSGVSFLSGGDALGSGTTLTNNNYKFTGNGHNSPIVTDGAGDTWFICHGHVKDQDFDKRMPLLDRLYWDAEGWPYLKTGSPTHTESAAPSFPSSWTAADPSTASMAGQHGYYDVFRMSHAALAALQAEPRNKVTHYAPEADGRTISRLLMRKYTPRPVAGADGDTDYLSYFITGGGASSIVFNTGATGLDLSHVTADTRLRMVMRTNAEPDVFGMELFNDGTTPAFTCSVNGYGTGYPLLAHWPSDNGWICLDIPFSRITEVCPGFDLNTLARKDWTGDYIKILAGRLKDSNFSIDACFLYTPAEISGVTDVLAQGDSALAFDGTTVSSATDGIEIVSLSGCRVAGTDGRSVSTAMLAPGIYVCRSGGCVLKIAVRRF